MKQFLLTCFFATALVAGAQNTFYVDQSNPSAADTNPGTADAPWSTLNVEKWTAGCTVILKGEYYVDAEAGSNVITVDATLVGSDGAVIYGYEPGDEEPGNYETFFVCDANKFTVKNLDITNWYNANSEIGYYNGGMFAFGADSELILENVNISNAFQGCVGRRGAAIGTSGKLTATDCSFENCVATQGGAIAITGSKPVKFTSCSFIGNNNNIGLECGARGGALYVNGGSNGSDLVVDKCYFEKNVSDCPGYSFNKYSSGGVIMLYGASPKLYITNSTFYKNEGGYAGSVLSFEKNTAAENNIDIRLINNTFLENTVNVIGTNQGVLIYLSGASSDKLHGLFTMVNNTSLENNTSNAQSLLFMNSCPIDVVFANNLSLDAKIIDDGEKVTELSWGWVLQENAGFEFNSVNITHNIIEHGFGGDHLSFDNDYLNSDETANVFPRPAADLRPSYELATELSNKDNIYYLPVGENSNAIDAGINSVVYAGSNIVPSTDILGNPIVNDIRDIGAWEYDSNGGVDAVIANTKKVSYSSTDCMVTVSETARIINVYDITGSLVAHADNTDCISLSSLNKGGYVVVAIINNESVIAKILR